jgi:signal transduction histidine kinase
VRRALRGAARALARLPIRVRVAATFALVMAVLLTVAGVGLYLALGATLRSGIDDGLRSRSADVAALARDAASEPPGSSPLTERGETVAQVLAEDGRVLDSSPALRGARLLTPEQVRRARAGTIRVDRPTIVRPADDDDTTRLLARPVAVRGRRVVVVVGATLEPVEVAQHRLAKLLLVGGPLLLLLASIAGYGAAAGALRPMDRMRHAAAGIRAGRSGTRLEVPPAGDEVARLAVTLNGMLDRLDDAFRRERAFVDDASHERRTPLAVLKGELELAMRRGASVEDLRAAVASAAEETDRLVALAQDLLVLARAEDGAALLGAETIPLGVLVERVRDRVPVGDARIALGPDAADVGVPGEPATLERILGNLVRNAADAGATRIDVRATDDGDAVEIHVLDDGPGFPDAFLPRAFERFARADEARARGGTGLGLSIVRSVAEAAGGSAGAANRTGGGADVWVVLPAPGDPAEPFSSRAHRGGG